MNRIHRWLNSKLTRTIDVHTHLSIRGEEVAHYVTRHQQKLQKLQKRNPVQRRGPNA